MHLFGYVILENHLHWIAAGEGLSDLIARFKSYTARQIIDELKTRGFSTMLDELQYYKLRHKSDQKYQLWQEGSHPQQILHHEMMVQKLEYMHHNPVRRGYVDESKDWRYSSARDYAGVKGLIEVETEWW
jgi:REP element-mobilizing transposase RayT